MRNPEMVARAGYAAARLEQAWERWRALHGLAGSSDPLTSYVGYSLEEPMVRAADTAEPAAMTGPASAEHAMMSSLGTSPAPVARGFHQAPVSPGRPQDTPDPLAAELAGWASGELPGQASEQLATWAAAESAPSTVDRPRPAR